MNPSQPESGPLSTVCTKHPRSPETPQLFCGSTNENKETSKVEKKTSDLTETQSNKPNLSLPTVPLQDKPFCSSTPNGSLLMKPHAGSLSSSWLRFGRFSAPFWQLPALLVLRSPWECCSVRHLPYFGEGQSSISLVGCPQARASGQDTAARQTSSAAKHL